MHYFGILRHTQSMTANKISANYSEKLHFGNVVNMPYYDMLAFIRSL